MGGNEGEERREGGEGERKGRTGREGGNFTSVAQIDKLIAFSLPLSLKNDFTESP